MQLAPDQVAAISGLRGMFRQSGSILCVSIVTAVLARSANPGIAQSHVFWVLALILVATSGVTLTIKDHRGSW